MTLLTVFAVNGVQVILLNRHNCAIYLVASYAHYTRATAVFLSYVVPVRMGDLLARSRIVGSHTQYTGDPRFGEYLENQSVLDADAA